MAWNYYAENEFGLMDACIFDSSLFGQSVAPNSYAVVQGEGGSPLVIGKENQIPWTAGQSFARQPLFYFAQYDSNDNIVGYVGYDLKVTSDYTILGHNAQVSAEITACTRDANKQIIQDLGGRSIGSAANGQSYAGFRLGFFLSIGKATDGQTIAVAGAVQIFNRDRLTSTSGYFWGGILSSNSAWQYIKYSTKEKSPEFGYKSIPKGGYDEEGEKHGTFDDSSDKITYSSKPTMHAGMSGFFHAYFVTQSQLQNIGKAMFPTASNSYADIIDALGGVITSIWNSKKVDCLVDCLVLPISVPFGNEVNVQCGGGDLIYFDGATWQNIKGFPVTDYYVDVDCGDFSLDEYWCNFLDYSGTRIKLFLPYVGFVDLQPEYLNGGSINVKYRFNVIDGSFMCVVHSTSGMSNLEESLIGQYSGMACLHIPITSQNYSNQISGLISSSGMAVTAGLTGNAGMAVGSAMNLMNTLAQKPSTAHNNGYNSSSSFLSHRTPYVIIERQVSQFSELYPTESGLPSYVPKPLSELHGFTILDNPVLNINCNDDEYNEIINLLKTGVIF